MIENAELSNVFGTNQYAHTLFINCATPITSFLPFNIGMHSMDLMGTWSVHPSSLSMLGCRLNEAAQTCTSAMFNNYMCAKATGIYEIISTYVSAYRFTRILRYLSGAGHFLRYLKKFGRLDVFIDFLHPEFGTQFKNRGEIDVLKKCWWYIQYG